jgi:hypothetical protein
MLAVRRDRLFAMQEVRIAGHDDNPGWGKEIVQPG